MIRTPLFLLSCASLILLLFSCTPDRGFLSDENLQPIQQGYQDIARGYLVINEFVATGSNQINEFGNNEDWFEIYNPNNFEVELTAGYWYVTDDGFSNPTKYQLPGLTIPARGFIVIWCDNEDVVAHDIHTNFALSASGEHLGIYFDDGYRQIMIDDYEYGPQQDFRGQSKGRFPDGADNWVHFQNPTPGQPNN